MKALKDAVPEGLKTLPRMLQYRMLNAMAASGRRNVQTNGTVFISSWPRSGSTWLFEMLASDRSVVPIFEPLHPTRNPFMQPYLDALGFLAHPEPDDAKTLKAIFEDIYTGRAVTRWSASRAQRHRILTSPRTLVKEIRASLALSWLTSSFPETKTIVLLRHPCAVVESMLRTPGEWQRWSTKEIFTYLNAQLDRQIMRSFKDADRCSGLAALWALNARHALFATGQSQSTICLVTYEELVTRPKKVLSNIGNFAGLTDVYADPKRLSLLTHKQSPLREKSVDPLTVWQHKLSRTDIGTVLDTVERVGISIYNRDPYPDSTLMTATSVE